MFAEDLQTQIANQISLFCLCQPTRLEQNPRHQQLSVQVARRPEQLAVVLLDCRSQPTNMIAEPLKVLHDLDVERVLHMILLDKQRFFLFGGEGGGHADLAADAFFGWGLKVAHLLFVVAGLRDSVLSGAQLVRVDRCRHQLRVERVEVEQAPHKNLGDVSDDLDKLSNLDFARRDLDELARPVFQDLAEDEPHQEQVVQNEVHRVVRLVLRGPRMVVVRHHLLDEGRFLEPRHRREQVEKQRPLHLASLQIIDFVQNLEDQSCLGRFQEQVVEVGR